MLESGFKISDLNNIPLSGDCPNFKNKIALDNTFFLGYAHTVYGINYNRQNYKISLNSLREDIKGYIGISSLVSPWTEQMKFWHGYWYDKASPNKSYVYDWKPEESTHKDYNPEKFKDLENSYYIIKKAPFPFETEDLNNRGERGEKQSSILNDGVTSAVDSINLPLQPSDPYPNSTKIVTKDYIDERLAAKRLVEVSTDFWVRDYDCTYVIRAEEIAQLSESEAPEIVIHLPEEFNKRCLHNTLDFSILVEGIKSETGWKSAVKNDNIIKWKFLDFQGAEITPVWANLVENTGESINIGQNELYGNSQYIHLHLRAITSDIAAEKIISEIIPGENILTGYSTFANFNIFITCENLLYRSSGVKVINGVYCSGATIDSTDKSIKVDSKEINGNLEIDLGLDIKTDDENLLKITKSDIEEGSWTINFDRSGLDIPAAIDIKAGDHIDIDDSEKENGKWTISVDSDSLNIPPKTEIKSSSDFIDIKETPADTGTWEVGFIHGKLPKLLGDDYISITPKTRDDNSVENYSLMFNASLLQDGTKIFQELPDEIPLDEIENISYWSAPSKNELITIKYKGAEYIEYNKLKSFDLYYTPKIDGVIENESNSLIIWTMTTNGSSPIFLANKTYCISFTYIQPKGPLSQGCLYARIKWFSNVLNNKTYAGGYFSINQSVDSKEHELILFRTQYSETEIVAEENLPTITRTLLYTTGPLKEWLKMVPEGREQNNFEILKQNGIITSDDIRIDVPSDENTQVTIDNLKLNNIIWKTFINSLESCPVLAYDLDDKVGIRYKEIGEVGNEIYYKLAAETTEDSGIPLIISTEDGVSEIKFIFIENHSYENEYLTGGTGTLDNTIIEN